MTKIKSKSSNPKQLRDPQTEFVRYSRKFQHVVRADHICMASWEDYPQIPSMIGLFIRNKRTRIDMYVPLDDPKWIGDLIADLQDVKSALEERRGKKKK